MYNKNKKILFWLVIPLMLVAGAWLAATWSARQPALAVNYLDVGQGDATLVVYQQHYQLLIDGGPDGKSLMHQLGKFMPVGDNRIEIVILTHPDMDHLAGLTQAVKYYQIGLFLDNGQRSDTEIYNELYALLDAKKIKRESIGDGTKITINNQLGIAVLHPDVTTFGSDEKNDASVVLRMDYGENSFIFMGDAGEATEKDLLGDNQLSQTDWLKVAHHGAKSSTSQIFLEQLKPAWAVISVGKDNRYRHPAQEVLERLQTHGVNIARTDEQGALLVACEGAGQACRLLTK